MGTSTPSSTEDALVEELSARSGRPQWEVFDAVDAVCERVARDGDARLERSVV